MNPDDTLPPDPLASTMPAPPPSFDAPPIEGCGIFDDVRMPPTSEALAGLAETVDKWERFAHESLDEDETKS